MELLDQVIPWISMLIRVFVSLAVIGLSLVMVRRNLPRAGYALAGAAAIDMFSICCIRGMYTALSSEAGREALYDTSPDLIYGGAGCVGVVQTLLVAALTIAALVMMANEGKKPTAP